MKIIFLCGSLVKGRDGVGDYTRLLAFELIKRGHKVGAVALNDQNISNVLDEVEDEENLRMPVLQIPSVLPANKRYSLAADWVKKFNPDWVSLQFVIYSFHSKGLPFKLGEKLKSITTGRKVHVMFHETWIGTPNLLSFKKSFLSYLQRNIINEFLNVINPNIIHTHIPFYKNAFKKLGFEVSELALFSNIRLHKSVEFSNKMFVVGVFNQVDFNKNLQAFFTELYHELAENKLKLKILMIGGNSNNMKEVGDAICKVNSIKCSIEYTGFLHEQDVSYALQRCNIGVSTVPLHAIGKSGSIAAFLSHGVPVAVPLGLSNNGVKNQTEFGFFDKEFAAALIFKPLMELINNARISAIKLKDDLSIYKVTQKFLTDLQRNYD